MNSLDYIRNAGRQTPTIASKVLSTANTFLDSAQIKERENERNEHAKLMTQFFNKHVYTH